MWKIVKTQQNEIEDDLNSPTLFELYLYFLSHYLNVMKETILTLEKNDLSAIELHDVMKNLKDKLESRIKDNFFGAKARGYIKNFSPAEQKKFTAEAIDCYKRTLAYIQKYYNFNC